MQALVLLFGFNFLERRKLAPLLKKAGFRVNARAVAPKEKEEVFAVFAEFTPPWTWESGLKAVKRYQARVIRATFHEGSTGPTTTFGSDFTTYDIPPWQGADKWQKFASEIIAYVKSLEKARETLAKWRKETN